MIVIPPQSQCRSCRHFIGVDQPDGTEETERLVCFAFPDGISEKIVANLVSHRKPIPGDGGIQWEPLD
jgi:hypothetical protein